MHVGRVWREGKLKGVEEGRGLLDTSREPLPPHIDTSQI